MGNPTGKELIGRIFDAFAWRPRPPRIFPEHYLTADGENLGPDRECAVFEKHLAGVAPRELSFPVLDANPGGDRTSLLFLSRPEGALYYLPAIVALCIEDRDRADFLVDVLAWQFRSCGNLGEVLSWPAQVRAFPRGDLGDRANCLQQWFLDALPARNRLMNKMTVRERQTLAEYFAFEVRMYGNRDFAVSDFVERRAAMAFLTGRPYVQRLGARNAAENLALLDTLRILMERLQTAFSGHCTQAVEVELRANLAIWGKDGV